LFSPNKKEQVRLFINELVNVSFMQRVPEVYESGAFNLAAKSLHYVVEELLLELFVLKDVAIEIFGVAFVFVVVFHLSSLFRFAVEGIFELEEVKKIVGPDFRLVRIQRSILFFVGLQYHCLHFGHKLFQFKCRASLLLFHFLHYGLFEFFSYVLLGSLWFFNHQFLVILFGSLWRLLAAFS